MRDKMQDSHCSLDHDSKNYEYETAVEIDELGLAQSHVVMQDPSWSPAP